MASKSTITLKRSPSTRAWVAVYGGPYGEKLQRVLGYRWAPTPYGAEVAPETVLEAISALNPEMDVRLAVVRTPQVPHEVGGR